MINLFKDLKIKYTILTVALALLLLGFVFWSTYSVNINLLVYPVFLILYFSSYFLSMIIFEIIAEKRLLSILEILNEECEPYKYISQILPLTQQTMPNNTRVTVLIYLACGYINAGDIVQAKAVLADIPKFRTNNKINLANICNLWASIYLEEYDLKNAQLALADLLKYSNKIKSKEMKYRFTEFYNRHTAKLNMLMNNFSGVEGIYKSQLEGCKTTLEKNILYYNFALLCIKQNRITEAKQALQFVAANGNRLHLAAEAKEKLAQL